MVTNGSGYDAAHRKREHDDLDRWRFALEIVDVIESTPSDWSARIGIFGKWGEGKSTVLRFAEHMLVETGNLVFTFNPWAIQNWDSLWEEFGNALHEALSSREIKLETSWRQKAKHAGKWAESRGLGKIAEAVADFAGGGKAFDATFSALGRWLKYDGEQIKAIRQKLGDRRIVVLIDDLDRCAPELIPQLLLSLRELLDLPGFTFLLAFDNEIVGLALIEKNPAWTNGADFLEKILDFRFHIPPVTNAQKKRLVGRAVTNYCPFVPLASAEAVEDLLPDNPRKLKSLIRSLVALQPQIKRHNTDEFNWVDMWMAQMIRLESFAFFEQLLSEGVLEQHVGMSYEVIKELAKSNSRQKSEVDENLEIEDLIRASGVKNPHTTQRLATLIEAIRARATVKFRYACELALRPQAVTWGEFGDLFTSWMTARQPHWIKDWATIHATKRGLSIDDVNEEVFEAILSKRDQVLTEASDAASLNENSEFAQQAAVLLEMAFQFLVPLRYLSPARFQKLYQLFCKWIHFTTNPADKDLRLMEEKILIDILSSAPGNLHRELLEQLGLWDFRIGEACDEQRVVKLKRSLREKCAAVIIDTVAQEAIDSLMREGGARALLERGRLAGYKYCLFSPRSPVWTTSLERRLSEIILRGIEDRVIYQNVHYLVNLMMQAGNSRVDNVTREDIVSILKQGDFAKTVWKTITAREIQYRAQLGILQARDFLIAMGVPEVDLPLTKELQDRIESETNNRIRSDPGPAAQNEETPNQSPESSPQ